MSPTKDFHPADRCSTGEADRVSHPERGQETKVESVGERNRISREEKGLCGIS